MARKKKEDKEYLEPEEASKIVNGGDPPYKLPEENGNGNGGDKAAKEAQLLSSLKLSRMVNHIKFPKKTAMVMAMVETRLRRKHSYLAVQRKRLHCVRQR